MQHLRQSSGPSSKCVTRRYVGLFVSLLRLSCLFLVAVRRLRFVFFTLCVWQWSLLLSENQMQLGPESAWLRLCSTKYIGSIVHGITFEIPLQKLKLSRSQSHTTFTIKCIRFNYVTYPWAHVVLHSPLCNCNPLAHAVQFIRDTHWVQVCKHFAQTPASM